MSLRQSLLNLFGPLVVASVLTGCSGPDGPTLVKVSGKATYEGVAVEEGTIMFLHTVTQDSRQTSLGPAGTYEMEVMPGDHKVVIEPIVIEISSGKDSPAQWDYKKVSNIPSKYRSAEKSDLQATVTGPAEFSFDMQGGVPKKAR